MTRIQNICPRCGGNLFLERDEYDQHLYCLQCGFRAELGEINRVNYKANEEAAAVSLGGLTALTFLRDRANIQSG